MRTKTDHVRIEIQEATEAKVRSFTITITAPQDYFQLADLLRQRQVIQPFNRHLKRSIKNAATTYLRDADALVAGLVSKPKRAAKRRSYVLEVDSIN